MNVQLRNSNGYPGPLPLIPKFTRGRRRGIAATPGYTPEQQAMADAFLSQFGGGGAPAVYQAPTLVPTPACISGPEPYSAECQAQLMAAQQKNFSLNNDANRSVFVQNCLNTFPQPTDCYTRTYGQTPAGGYTSDAIVQGPQLILDARGNVVYSSASGASIDPATGEIPVAKTASTPAPSGSATGGAKSTSGQTGGSTQDSTGKSKDDSLLYWTVGLGVGAIVIGIWAANK